MNKKLLLNNLFEAYKQCKLCPLGDLGRTQLVFGFGNPNAKFMIIGEAPGKKEDLKGEPFVGLSGKLLTRSIENLKINRDDIYITNIVKCRPPNNRTPLFNEISTCKKVLLEKQIEIIKPKIICTLGASALNALIPTKSPLRLMRGTLQTYQSIPVLPTFHPSYILRKRGELATFSNDLQFAYKQSL